MEHKSNRFVTWTNQQLEKNNWSYRELSRRSDISHTHIAKILNGEREVTWDFAVKISHVFGLPIWDAFLMSGLVSSVPDEIMQNEKERVILELYRKLSPEGQQEILEFIQYQAHKYQIL